MLEAQRTLGGLHALEPRPIEMRYTRADDGSSVRTVWPLGLAFWGTKWTLAAWCELRDDYRTFRVDRVQELDVLDERFEETEEISLATLLSRFAVDSSSGRGDAEEPTGGAGHRGD